jgi:hypothetical protein
MMPADCGARFTRQIPHVVGIFREREKKKLNREAGRRGDRRYFSPRLPASLFNFLE